MRPYTHRMSKEFSGDELAVLATRPTFTPDHELLRILREKPASAVDRAVGALQKSRTLLSTGKKGAPTRPLGGTLVGSVTSLVTLSPRTPIVSTEYGDFAVEAMDPAWLRFMETSLDAGNNALVSVPDADGGIFFRGWKEGERPWTVAPALWLYLGTGVPAGKSLLVEIGYEIWTVAGASPKLTVRDCATFSAQANARSSIRMLLDPVNSPWSGATLCMACDVDWWFHSAKISLLA